MRYFFIEQSEVNNQTPVISGSDAKHVKNVLRLKPGDKIGLFDGNGFEYEARIVTLLPDSIKVSILSRSPSLAESPVQITVAQALLKDRKMDGLIRQLTELGISKWVPFIAKRSVPRPDTRQLAARMERWNKIAREALKQSRRGHVTETCEILSFENVLKYGDMFDLKITFWEKESRSVKSVFSQSGTCVKTILVMIGPEGGFTQKEIEDARACGFIIAGLGPRILRSETATIAACSLLQYLFGDMG